MYTVLNKLSVELDKCETLDSAMAVARQLGFFVTIKSASYEICGVFGVDSIKDGVCPDGVAYDWMKRRKQ